MSEIDIEIQQKMQDAIRKKHLGKDEDEVLTLNDGTEVKIQYAEDK